MFFSVSSILHLFIDYFNSCNRKNEHKKRKKNKKCVIFAELFTKLSKYQYARLG